MLKFDKTNNLLMQFMLNQGYANLGTVEEGKVNFKSGDLVADREFSEYGVENAGIAKMKIKDGSTSRNQEPERESGDLQEEIKLFLDKTGAPYYWAGDKEQMEWLEFAARHFAEWQKRKDNEVAQHNLAEQIKIQQKCYERGMADMKQQMLKDGIEAHVRTDVPIDDDYVYVRAYIKKDKLEEGEKVRLLIIKDEDN